MTTNLLNALEQAKALEESYYAEYAIARENAWNIYKTVCTLEEKYEENQDEETGKKLDEVYDIYEKANEAEKETYDKYDKIDSAIIEIQDVLDLLDELGAVMPQRLKEI